MEHISNERMLLKLKKRKHLTTCVRHEIMWIHTDYNICPICSGTCLGCGIEINKNVPEGNELCGDCFKEEP